MGIDFNINIQKKFTVNGKTYGSLEEMPEEARQAVAKALGGEAQVAISKTKIVVNGKTYGSEDEMSPEQRRLYDDTMQMLRDKGQLPPETELPEAEPPETEFSRPPAGLKVVRVETPGSARWAIFALLLLGIVLLLCWLCFGHGG